MFLPRALSAIPDARNALQRLSKVFHAELMTGEPFEVDEDGKWAVSVEEAIFEWESARKEGKEVVKKGEKKDEKGKAKKRMEEKEEEDRKPFQVRLKEFKVDRGSLVAIVGPVGSGKVNCIRHFEQFIYTDKYVTVESPTRSHRRDEKSKRRGGIRRTSQLLCTDSLDTKCYSGKRSRFICFSLCWLDSEIETESRGTMSCLGNRSTRINTGKLLRMLRF